MNTLHLLPFCDLDDREFIFVNNISSIKFHEVMESDFYNLLPNPDKNDEADPDLMFINPQSDYYSISKMNNVLTSRQGKGISLFHCNIRSLTKNLNLLNDMLYSLDSGLDVIAITETRLNPNSISNTELLNYNLFHVDSPTLAGGVAIYANKALKTIPRPDLKIDLPLVESCWIEIDPCNNNRHILIGCIYRHPSAGMDEFTVKLEELIKESNLNKYDTYILGDMNIDLLKHHTHQQTGQYIDMLYSYDLLPVITKPTRITSHTATLIDHIYTNTINNLVSGIVTVDISDHLPIFCVAGVSPKRQCTKLFYRDVHTLKQLYYSFIYPYLTYGITSWGSACKTRLQKIKTKQNRCVRSIFFAHSRDSAMSYLNLLQILTLDNVYKFKLALFIHKIKNGPANIPTIFSGSLTLASEVHSYNTRFATNFNIYRPNINNNYGATTFSFLASKIWESIPFDFKKLSYNRFYKQYKMYLLNTQYVSLV